MKLGYHHFVFRMQMSCYTGSNHLLPFLILLGILNQCIIKELKKWHVTQKIYIFLEEFTVGLKI